MLDELEWLKVEDLLEMKALTFVHRIKLGLMPEYINNKISIFNHNYGTRYKENFILDHRKTAQYQNSIFLGH